LDVTTHSDPQIAAVTLGTIVEQKIITLPMMAGYLKSQIACDANMARILKT
jgi:hypothetical protein